MSEPKEIKGWWGYDYLALLRFRLWHHIFRGGRTPVVPRIIGLLRTGAGKLTRR